MSALLPTQASEARPGTPGSEISQNGTTLETVKVIGRKAILAFIRVHKDAEGPLDAGYRTVLRARWGNLTQARKDLPNADAVGERTVFVLTHNEYDKDAWKK